MATYKVLQDVEAEDKILGPLTLRQFIYAGIAAICLYLTYFAATHKAGFMAVVLLPVAAIGAFFAYPWSKDQPTEVWALAKIRFMIKPRRRIWDQSGFKELVTITAPKHVEANYTNGLTETEVRSRLHALADTLDSRGWAVKNANLSSYTQPPLVMAEPNPDRLLSPNDFPQQVSNLDIRPTDDILDEQNNPVAQQVDTMMAASAKAHRQKIMDELAKPMPEPEAPAAKQPKQTAAPTAPQNNYWFLNQPSQTARIPDNMVTFNTQVVSPAAPASDGYTTSPPSPGPVAGDPTLDEQQLVERLEAKKRELPMAAYYGHLHTIQPLSVQQQQAQAAARAAAQQPFMPNQPPMQAARPQTVTANATASTPSQQPTSVTPYQPPQPPAPQTWQPTPPPVTPAQQAAILQLANNDDLNVATIAREAANRSGALEGEVVIKLH